MTARRPFQADRSSQPHELPDGFSEAIHARIERDVLPDLPPDMTTRWRRGLPFWELLVGADNRTVAVDVFTSMIEDGRIHLARLDATTLGVVIDDDGWEWRQEC